MIPKALNKVKDIRTFSNHTLRNKEGFFAIVEIDREAYYKLNKMDKTHDAKLIVYNRDEYLNQFK